MLAAEQGEQTSERAAVHADISPLLRGGEAEEGAAAVPAEPAGRWQPAPQPAGRDGEAEDGAAESSRGEGGHGGQLRQGEGPAEEGMSVCLSLSLFVCLSVCLPQVASCRWPYR